MTEKELIGRIRELGQIKPSRDWVVLTKNQILGPEPKGILFPFLRLASISLGATLLILFGLFYFAQKALPGDFLYPIKKIAERGQAFLVSETELPKIQLELANKRLEELNKIVEQNEVKKLPLALNELQTSTSRAAKNLVKVKKINREIVENTLKFEKTKEKIENSLATQIEIKEEENPTKIVAEYLIKDLEGRTLSEEEKEIFTQAKKDFENGDYSTSLEKILILSNNK
jgi:hypothetical protein